MPSAHYDYFDHEADIGIIGAGPTLEAAFVQAARAVFAYMATLDEVQPIQCRAIEFIEEDSELALVEWLNALLGEARQSNLVFSSFTLVREQNRWSGQAWGEPWRDSQERGTEVKGATLTMLSVKSNGAEWEARCVIDI